MKDSMYIKTRLDDEIATFTPGTEEKNTIHNNRIAIWNWLYNDGNLRTEIELNNRLNNYVDELHALEFIGDKNEFSKKLLNIKIKIVKEVMESYLK